MTHQNNKVSHEEEKIMLYKEVDDIMWIQKNDQNLHKMKETMWLPVNFMH